MNILERWKTAGDMELCVSSRGFKFRKSRFYDFLEMVRMESLGDKAIFDDWPEPKRECQMTLNDVVISPHGRCTVDGQQLYIILDSENIGKAPENFANRKFKKIIFEWEE
jgi:hypothetical protein